MELKTNLFEYQMQAVKKLQHIKVGALYMEQGTGKTRTALELIKKRLDAGKINNVLWLCPCTIKDDIRFNIDSHISRSDFIDIYGIESLSQSDRLYLKLLDLVAYKKTYLIVDESNLVKNYFAKRTKRITNLANTCKYKLILNGTPISKNEADLFAQWYILDWRILGYKSFWSFEANHLEYDDYGNVRRVLNVDYLSEKIAPYSYSIEKSECLDIPNKKYETVYYDLTREQEKEYEKAKDLLLSNIDEFDSTTIYKLFTGLQQVVSGNRLININPLINEPIFSNPLDNPRIRTLLEEVECMDGKIIIWCKFKKEIEDISTVLKKYGEDNIALLYGDIKLKNRKIELDKFRNKSRFLIANKTCGGYGLNLQFCSNMIYYSNDFNWATRAQSEDRAHRIGQKNEVNIVDICADSKIDERILTNLQNKENLSDWFKKELVKGRNNVINLIDGRREIYDSHRIKQKRKTERAG